MEMEIELHEDERTDGLDNGAGEAVPDPAEIGRAHV
jgi:hypothetical protein